MKILLIEDDAETLDYVANGLKENGHRVDLATNGRDGLCLAVGETYDVMIIDRMLPGLEGLGVVKAMRAAEVRTPVLFLTALGGIDDRVEGLEGGGDDYLTKPFAFAELLARLNALARRPSAQAVETSLKVGDLEMNLIKRTVCRGDQRVDLQPQEFKLLEYLMRNADRVVTKSMLLENVWGFHFDPRTGVVETHMSRLRGKVDRGFDGELIHTIRGAGYCIRDDR